MPQPWLIGSILAVLLSGIAAVSTAIACGGVKAFIVDELPTTGVRQVQGPNKVTFYSDTAGHALLPASVVKVDSALAEAIARRYLAQFQGSNDSHLEFEGLVYEHGDFVYMYHADVPGLAYSVHIGPVSYVSEHAHIHVSATTGAVYGPGCGLGSGTVVMPFAPDAYAVDIAAKRLPYVQFDSHFVVRNGAAPQIDGAIEPQEWVGAGHVVLTVGTRHPQVTAYGWGGRGQPAVAEPAEAFTVDIWSRLVGDTIAFAVRTDTERWVAVLFKDFPHHGMIGDFNDAKLLTTEGIGDYFVAARPEQRQPGPRHTSGVHTWMAAGILVQDAQSNLLASAHRIIGQHREYEFTFPLHNDYLGDTLWERDRTYMVAVLIGPQSRYTGIDDAVWMSDQVLIRLGSASTESIYRPPLTAATSPWHNTPGGTHQHPH